MSEPTTGVPRRIVAIFRSVAHLSYLESTLDALARRGCQVQLLFDPHGSRNRSSLHAESWAATNGMPPLIFAARRNDRWKNVLSLSRELRTYSSYLRRSEQSSFYLRRWRGYLPSRVRYHLQRRTVGRILHTLLKTRVFDWLCQGVETIAPADPEILRLLRSLEPDAALVTPANLQFSEEIDYLKAAKKLKIPTILPVLSWDNLTTKGLIHCKPDRLLVWNDLQAEEAVRFHGIPQKNISVTGSPFFDRRLDAPRARPEARQEFCGRLGLSPDLPYLLYLGSSANIASDESGIVEALGKALDGRYQILVRPHPAHLPSQPISFPANVRLWPRELFGAEGAVPESKQDLADFQQALQFSAAAIGVNTSAMIDAVLENKPCLAYFSPLFKGTQQDTIHFRRLFDSGVLYPVKAAEGVLDRLELLAEGKDPAAGDRRSFVAKFIRPAGRSAGEAQAQEVLGLLDRRVRPLELRLVPAN